MVPVAQPQKGAPSAGSYFTAVHRAGELAGKTELKTLKSLEQGRVITVGHAVQCHVRQRAVTAGAATVAGLDGLPELYLWLLQLATDSHLEHTLRLFEKRCWRC